VVVSIEYLYVFDVSTHDWCGLHFFGVGHFFNVFEKRFYNNTTVQLKIQGVNSRVEGELYKYIVYQEHHGMKHNVTYNLLPEPRLDTSLLKYITYKSTLLGRDGEAKGIFSLPVKYACCIDTAHRYNKSLGFLFRNEKIAICRVFFSYTYHRNAKRTGNSIPVKARRLGGFARSRLISHLNIL